MSKLSKIKFKYGLKLIAILCGFSLFLFSKYIKADSFLECIEDIPISNEFIESESDCFNFDSSTGKISLAVAKTLMNFEDIKEYYMNILPSFGWEVKEFSEKEYFMLFVREKDVLKISVQIDNNKKFLITYNLLSLIK